MDRAEGGGADDVAVHLAPVWRARADFLICADIAEGRLPKRWEQLWARQVSATRFVLCCIPFFAYDLALGDEVATGPAGGKRYVVRRVTTPSGHSTFRVWLGQSTHPTIRTEVTDEVARYGGELEWSSRNLLAVSVAAGAAQAVADWLWQREQQGHLIYETGRTR